MHDGSEPLDKPRWERFAQLLAGDAAMTQSDAYRGAGYSPGTAHKAWCLASALHARPEVQARIAYLRAAAAQRAGWDRDQHVAWLLSVMHAQIGDTDADGVETPARIKERLSAAAQIAKVLGLERAPEPAEGATKIEVVLTADTVGALHRIARTRE